MRANLDLLLDWAHAAGLGDLALENTQALSAAINLLATPPKKLLQVSAWGAAFVLLRFSFSWIKKWFSVSSGGKSAEMIMVVLETSLYCVCAVSVPGRGSAPSTPP